MLRKWSQESGRPRWLVVTAQSTGEEKLIERETWFPSSVQLSADQQRCVKKLLESGKNHQKGLDEAVPEVYIYVQELSQFLSAKLENIIFHKKQSSQRKIIFLNKQIISELQDNFKMEFLRERVKTLDNILAKYLPNLMKTQSRKV